MTVRAFFLKSTFDFGIPILVKTTDLTLIIF